MDELSKELIIEEKLSKVKHIYVVLSGKGGVGKSTVAVNLALGLSLQGFRTGILDVDIHGPSIPKMLGLSGKRFTIKNDEIIPIECYANVNVVSMAFLLDDHRTPVIWRGPAKANIIREFISHVDWGNLDYLVVDCPPGTGDEPLSIGQLLGKKAQAIIVTTPQEVATIDVEKCITFCRELGLPIAGIVENMSGFVCPHCGKETLIFSHGGGEELARSSNVPFLGKVPLDPEIVVSGDSGKPYMYFFAKSQTGKRFEEIVERLIVLETTIKPAGNENTSVTSSPGNAGDPVTVSSQGDNTVKFAVPTHQGKLCQHFGHCEAFAILETAENGAILSETYVDAPEHQPGLLPQWLSEKGVRYVIAGGMGSRAQQLFAEKGVKVVTGAQGENPREIVEQYLKGVLMTGANICDH